MTALAPTEITPRVVTTLPPPTSTRSVPLTAATVPLPPGPFICKNAGPEVYLVFGSQRRHIVDWETFLGLGFRQDQVRDCRGAAAYPEGAPLTRLLKGSGAPVYWLEDGQRRHVPDMETFQALGYQMTDIAVVSDELLAVWPEGEPLPLWHGLPTGAAGPLQLPATATPAEGAAPTATTLRDALAAIHSRYQIGPSRGCFDLLSPYPEYHRGLEEMTTLVLTDSRAAGLNDLDRQVLFHEVTGFDGARFFHAEGATATLVSLRTNRGYNLGCGSHYASPDALQVVDAEGHIYDVGSGGLLVQVWWVADRWVVLLRLKLDSTSGPTPWAIWHVGQGTAGWQRLVELEFTPTPYNFSLPPTLHFENGYQTLVADLDYWWADDPCPFTTDFTSLYKHDTWQMRRTYRLTDNTYTLISSEVLTFTAQRQDTGEAAPLNWQDYCGGPIQ